jgi:ribosomal protein S18 acetylase RimI-like enzyme
MPEDIKRNIYNDLGLEKNGVDYGSFLKEFDSNQELRKSVHKDLGLESNGVDFNSFEDKLGFKKKVQSASGETSFSQPFMATPITGEPTLSTVSQSPSKQQKSTFPSVFTEKGRIDSEGAIPKNLQYVADAIKADKIQGDERKRFIGETTSNIYSSVVEPNIDLFVSQKDQPTMYGTKKIPAGTVNTDAVYDAVDAYAEKYKKQTGKDLDTEARQAIAVGVTDQIKSRDKKFKAAALIDMDLKSQNLPTLSQLNIQAQDKVNKVKGLVEERNNFIKSAIKNPDKQIMGEATSEVDMLKSEVEGQAAQLNRESQGFYENTFNAELQPVIRQYQQLVDTRQMTPEQANSELKAAAEGLSEKIKQDTNARYAPMYDELNKASKQKSIEIQTKYNRKLQDKIKSQLGVFDRNIDALIKESDDLPPNYKKSVEEASKKAYGYLFKEEEAQKLQNFRNLNIGEKIGRAWEAGLADVLSTVGGAINMTGFDAQGVNELSLKAEQLTGVPSAAWSDKDVMDSFTDLDWWIVNGVRSLPFTVFTMPTGIIGGSAFGTLASALNATKRAQMISSVVGGGLIGWEAERLLEAGGSYKEAIDNGMSREEAARIAKDSMDLQLSTLPMNIAQMLPFFGKGFKFMKSAGIEGVSGYLEEVLQGWSGQRARNLAEDKEQRGIGEAVNSFGNYFFSKEALQEGTIGAAVGQAMTMASLTNTPDIDLQINGIMSSLSVGGESQARKMLEIMAKNGAISEAELNEYNNLIDYTLEGIAQTESFPVSDSIRASLINKYVGLIKARSLVTDDDNSLATQAAVELVQEKEKEIKNILKGTEPVYLVFPKGSDIPIVTTKEQVEQILKRPEYLEAFDIEINNDQSTQAKLDEVNAAIETQKNKQALEEAAAAEEVLPVEAAPVVEGKKTENELKVEELRAQEQAEKDATDPNDQEKLDEIYNRYDKLITPLLEKEGSVDVGGEEEVSESKASEPSKSDKNYQEAQEVSSIVSKENPAASVLIQPKGDNLSLTAVYVGKEKRGKGIGTKVLESVKKQADRLGKKIVLDATNELDSETDLERLGNFYEKNGFKKIGENKYEYEPKAKDSSRDIGSRADDSRAKKSDISADTNKKQPSKKVDSTEEAVSESQAEALPTEEKSQAKPVQEVPANIQEIADVVGENPNKVQNIYNKYGDKAKNISEITQEDYDKAVKAREKSKEKIKLEAIEAKIKQGNLTKLEAKKEANKIEELKKQDPKQVKEVEDFMKLLPDLQKALLESGEIKTIDCKWGK